MTTRTVDIFKVIICGDSGVGKTSFSRTLVGTYDKDKPPKSTIAVDLFTKTFSNEGKSTKLQVWDLSGVDTYRTIIDNYFLSAGAAIVMCSFDDMDSVDNIGYWIEKIESKCPSSCIKILCINKYDLTTENSINIDTIDFPGKKYLVSSGDEKGTLSFFLKLTSNIAKNNNIVIVEKEQPVPGLSSNCMW